MMNHSWGVEGLAVYIEESGLVRYVTLGKLKHLDSSLTSCQAVAVKVMNDDLAQVRDQRALDVRYL